jgi:hypothetical protein
MLKVSVAAYLSGSRVLIDGPVFSEAVLELSALALEFAFVLAFAFAFESVVVIGLHALTNNRAAELTIVPIPMLDQNLTLRFCIITSALTVL